MKKELWCVKLKCKDQPKLYSSRFAMEKSILEDDIIEEVNKFIITPEWVDGAIVYSLEKYKTKIKGLSK